MKHTLFISIAFLAALSVSAENISTDAAKEQFAVKAGGMVIKPNSSSGRIVFINTQSERAESNIADAIAALGDVIAKYTVVVEADVPGKPRELKEKHNANNAVIIVADDNSPSLIVAPEECWALVNVRPLSQGLKTDAAKAKFYNSRCRKEIMRGFACAAGGLGSSFPGNIMNVTRVPDLDLCDEFIPFDKAGVIKKHLKDNGVTPSRYATYRIACREGWAPAPTNDVQKAIWDKVHAMPTEPIKIKPEEKKTEK